MPKITKQNASKIGLFSTVMLIFGSVVGIGIFFKNYGIFRSNHGNYVGVLASWIISIFVVLCIALSFGEMVSCKSETHGHGLGGWATFYCGHNFGRFTKLFHNQVYYSVITFAIMFFSGEALLNCFTPLAGSTPGYIDFGKGTTLYIFLIGAALFVLFVFLNYYVAKGMSKFSNVAAIAKFVPIGIVIVLGIIFGLLQGGGLWNGNWIAWQYESSSQQWILAKQEIGNFDISNVIKCIPSILFSFEGYLVIGNVANEVKNPKKNVSLAIVIAMVIICALYLAVTIGCMTIGTGNIYHLMYVICGKDNINTANVLNVFMSIMVFICIIGVLNAMIYIGMRAMQKVCVKGILFHGKKLVEKNPNGLYAGGTYFGFIVSIIWFGVGMPSCILNTDIIADSCTSIMIVIIYFVYGTTLLFGFANRFRKNRKEVIKIKIFPVTSIIGAISCYFVFIYSGIYQSLVLQILNANKIIGPGLGLFAQSVEGTPLPNILNEIFEYGGKIYHGHMWVYWQTCAVFWSVGFVMIFIPFANDLLIFSQNKNNPDGFIWKKPKVEKMKVLKK